MTQLPKLCSLFVLSLFLGSTVAQVAPIPHSHAHNDYEHCRPLTTALANGFMSIEADVFLHKGQLVVSHVPLLLNHKKTLQQLYLDPLQKRIRTNEGWVYSGYAQPIVLMLDFKTDGAATYLKLKEILADYQDIITVYRGDTVLHQKAVNLLISGSSPIASLQREDTARATADAGLGGISDASVRRVATRFSGGWGGNFGWRGIAKMPKRQREKLHGLVQEVHRYHKQIRFWAIPDNRRVWRTLLAEHVDWINTNRLNAFSQFMKQNAGK